MPRQPRLKTRTHIALFVITAFVSALLPVFPAHTASTSALASARATSAWPRAAVLAETPYRQTNLVSELPGLAPVENPVMAGPWGIAARPSGSLVVANSGTNTASLYRGDVGGSPFVRNSVLPRISVLGGQPTGVAANTSNDFVVSFLGASEPAHFLFATLAGNISAWSPEVPEGATAHVVAGQPGRSYTGLAIANNGAGNFLYAADFAGGRIDVYNGSFALQTSGFPFVDPSIPSGFHPHNIRALGGKLYVAYARKGFSSSLFEGFVSAFDLNGNFVGPRITSERLNVPWGLALAPSNFGAFSNALLVANTSAGAGVNAFDASTGAFIGALAHEGGHAVGGGVVGLTFGNGAGAGDASTLYFTSNVPFGTRGLLGSLKPTQTPASLVHFAADNHLVTESGRGVDVTVRRTGDLSQPASVSYATFDGNASQTSDYVININTLHFGAGEAAKTIRVLVNDNFDIGGGGWRQLGVVLVNPADAGLGNPHTTRISITDDEFHSDPPDNPIDDIRLFVRQHYLDFLLREPDSGGFDSWVNLFLNCPPNNPACDRVAISSSFFRSREFQMKGFLVIRFYRAALGRDPLYGEFMGDLNRLTGATAEEVAARRAAFPAEFLMRPEQRDALEGLSNAQYVNRLVGNTGVNFSPATRDQLVADLDSGAKTRADVLREIVEAPQFANSPALFNRAFVMSQYFGYLRRNPEPHGFNAWLSYLNSNPNDFRTMVNGFVNSREYRNRFID